MAKKICLISDHHVSINPRLWKEAFLYEKMGFDVVIITQWTSDYFLQKDHELLQGHRIRYECYLDMREGNSNSLRRFFFRARKRAGTELRKRFGISKPWSVTYAPGLLYKRAIKEQADFYSAHLEAGFIAGGELVRSGKKVGFDLEDWYSRDYMTADRAIDLLHRAEGFALSQGRFFTTTSESMARGISEVWKSQKPITVIYNSFPDEDLTNPVGIDKNGNDNKPFRLLWTSRSVGSGRGIETLLKALTYLEIPVEVHLIGQLAKGYREFLQEHWPVSQGHRLCLVEFMPHRELSALIPGFDLGLAIENNFPDNKDRTISNKILQYIQAGIKVLATDTKGQVEVADDFPESVFLVPVDQPERWASQIRNAIQQRSHFDQDRQADTYRKKFAWPAQEEKLKQLITQHI